VSLQERFREFQLKIPFNIPYTTGFELQYINEAITNGHLSGNGPFTLKCQEFLEREFGFNKVLLTTSCTDALEMAAILLDIKQGDEVIVPAYTFVSTALAFSRQGATVVFADSRPDNPCIDEALIEALVTERTKAIVPVHYNGIACEMDTIMALANKYGIAVVEDAAHSFGAKYKGRYLGSIGDFGCLSFHETKVIHCGEGGMLAVNNQKYDTRAEVIWEKGTNRAAFKRNEVQKYEWIDTGSSFLMSDLNAAFLYAQLVNYKTILKKRRESYLAYEAKLGDSKFKKSLSVPFITEYAETNYGSFYILMQEKKDSSLFQSYLNSHGVQVVTHYLDLSVSPFALGEQKSNYKSSNINCRRYQDSLIRLPLYFSLSPEEISYVIKQVGEAVVNLKVG
jgi:dTDP-4-amino-4,6-dideoxygalactose transaminase